MKLYEKVPKMLEDVPLGIRRRIWFQQDGAPAHLHRNARQYMNNAFPNRWIGRNGPVEGPPRSTDMTPLDFFLRGYMKSLIYETLVESEMDLVARIVVAAGKNFSNIRVFERVRQSILKRYQTCTGVGDRHLKQLL